MFTMSWIICLPRIFLTSSLDTPFTSTFISTHTDSFKFLNVSCWFPLRDTFFFSLLQFACIHWSLWSIFKYTVHNFFQYAKYLHDNVITDIKIFKCLYFSIVFSYLLSLSKVLNNLAILTYNKYSIYTYIDRKYAMYYI